MNHEPNAQPPPDHGKKSVRVQRVLWILLLFCTFFCSTFTLARTSGLFSAHLEYRRQTNALLSGSLSIADSPVTTEVDWGWGDHGLQQQWNLGIPLLRLPFEFVTQRLLGTFGFPDRLILFWLIGVCWLAFLNTLRKSSQIAAPSSANWIRAYFDYFAVSFLALAPCWLQLLGIRFKVYEEAVAVLLIWQILIFTALLSYWIENSFKRLLILSLLCAFAPWPRLTGGFPALVAISLATLRHAIFLKRYREALCAAALCACGPALLLYTNLIRFGSFTEFGHTLSMSCNFFIDFLVRFEHPFQDEGFLSASLELLGSLFLNPSLDAPNFFGYIVEPLQSSTTRMREFYFQTFSPIWLLFPIVGSTLWLYFVLSTPQRRHNSPRNPLGKVSALWSIPTVTLLFLFYLRTPALTSRYLMDFFPALAIFCLGIISTLCAQISLLPWPSFRSFLQCAVITLSGYLLLAPGSHSLERVKLDPPIHSISAIEAQQKLTDFENYLDLRRRIAPPLPEEFHCGDSFKVYGIRTLGQDWSMGPNCSAHMATVVFFHQAACYSLVVRPLDAESLPHSKEDWGQRIRLKENLNYLTLRNVEKKEDTFELTYCSPTPPKTNLQPPPIRMLSIAWTTKDILKYDGPVPAAHFSLLAIRRLNLGNP